jgi:type VI secretion system protein ImpE
MSAHERFKRGELAEAIAAQNELVKQRPTDPNARFELFVFLCFAGELERAEKQLDVLENRDGSLQRGGVVFRNLLASEFERRQVGLGRGRPVVPPVHPAYLVQRLEAFDRLRNGDVPGAEACIERAIADTPPLAGRIDGEPFEGLCDFDDVLGSVIEVFAGGRYLWLPLEHVRSLELSEPATALDTLWVPARLQDADGDTASVHIPALYAGSHGHADGRVRLGRETEWERRGSLSLGRGQRIWVSASGDALREHPLLSVRRLEIASGAGAA